MDGLDVRPPEKKGEKGIKDKDVPEELTKIQMVYAQDHDFYCCCHRKEDTDFETFFLKGLDIYIAGDWDGAQMAFDLAFEKNPKDGPLNHLRKLIEKNKGHAPDEWDKAFDWDQKPEPPPIDYESLGESEMDEEEENKEWSTWL